MVRSVDDFRFGSGAAVAGRPMAQPVYPQLRKYPCVSALTFRARSGHALFLKLGACLPSSIVPAIVNSNIKSWADAQRQPAPRARWLSSFGRRCGRSGN
jgi:hypothetical protein